MINITKLYKQLQEGKTSRNHFVREARRQFPQYISPVNSYGDIVTVLKGKRLISEEITKEVSGAQFDAPVVNEATLRDLIKPLTSKLESMGYDVDYDSSFGFMALEAFKTLPDGSVLRMYLRPSDKELQQKNYSGRSEDFSTIDVSFTHWTTEVTNQLFGLYKQKTRVMKNLPDSEGENIDLGVGMFDIPIENSVEKITALVKRAEQKVQGPESQLQEAQTLSTHQVLDRLPAYAVKKGIEFELAKIGELTDEALEKAKKRVATKLKKNPSAYDDLIVSNAKKIEKKDKDLETKEVKQEMTDAKNKMVKTKGQKADKANTKVSTKENRKGKPKGVKVMKEDVLAHLKSYIAENVNREYHPGMEVITPDGPGVVKEVIGGTLTIEMHGGDLKDYQFNIINKHMDDANEPKQEETAQYHEAEEAKKEEGASEYSGMTYEEKAKLVMEKIKAIKDEAKKAKVMEILYQKKSKSTRPGDVNPNPPVSLNPSNPGDQKTINDPDFRANYERVKR